MKKSLLFISVLFLCSTMSAADKVWDFSILLTEDKTLDVGNSDVIAGELMAISEKMSIDNTSSTSMKKWTTGSYHTRLKTGGSGAVATANCLALKVSGNSTIQVCAVSSSSSAVRKLEVASADGTVIGSMLVDGNAGKDETIDPPTFTYTGAETVIYIYSAKNVDADTDGYTAGGLNLYMVSATNATSIASGDIAVASVKILLSDKGIAYNGSQISNPNNIELKVYNTVGSLIMKSAEDINTSNLQKGIYVVKAAGIQGALKFTR
ncbi:MAG: hypothetical protein PHH37_03620 [Paludibacter sp.]|nr:hypothetical protein [Paludibacter sp.]